MRCVPSVCGGKPGVLPPRWIELLVVLWWQEVGSFRLLPEKLEECREIQRLPLPSGVDRRPRLRSNGCSGQSSIAVLADWPCVVFRTMEVWVAWRFSSLLPLFHERVGGQFYSPGYMGWDNRQPLGGSNRRGEKYCSGLGARRLVRQIPQLTRSHCVCAGGRD